MKTKTKTKKSRLNRKRQPLVNKVKRNLKKTKPLHLRKAVKPSQRRNPQRKSKVLAMMRIKKTVMRVEGAMTKKAVNQSSCP